MITTRKPEVAASPSQAEMSAVLASLYEAMSYLTCPAYKQKPTEAVCAISTATSILRRVSER